MSNPFYAGKVIYKGKEYPGRHEPLVSQELFDRVQGILKAHRQSGDRSHKHSHFLKGTIRCHHCDHRLSYSRNSGNGGTYEYFVCPYTSHRQCPNRYHRVDVIEAAIEDLYRTVALNIDEQHRVTSAIERHLAEMVTTSKKELHRCDLLLTALDEQEHKLLEKHYKDEITDKLFTKESNRIKRERGGAEAVIARLTIHHDELKDFLSITLKLASSNLHDLYLRAKPHIRRLMNQALFEAIWFWDEGKTRAQLASPFKELHAINQASRRTYRRAAPATPHEHVSAAADTAAPENDEAPGPWQDTGDFALGSNNEVMVAQTGP